MIFHCSRSLRVPGDGTAEIASELESFTEECSHVRAWRVTLWMRNKTSSKPRRNASNSMDSRMIKLCSTPSRDVTAISIPVIEYSNDPSQRAANGARGTDRCHESSVITRLWLISSYSVSQFAPKTQPLTRRHQRVYSIKSHKACESVELWPQVRNRCDRRLQTVIGSGWMGVAGIEAS